MPTLATQPWTADDLARIKVADDPQISPDGSRVAYVVGSADAAADTFKRSIHLAAADGSWTRELTPTAGGWHPRWSPDGTKLAFIRSGAVSPAKRALGSPARAPQVWVLDMQNGGEAQPITTLRWGVNDAVWSPDGKSIAISYNERTIDDPAAERLAQAGQRVPRIRHIDKRFYSGDSSGYTYEWASQLGIVTVATGRMRTIARADGTRNSAPQWSPDGTRIAFNSDRDTPENAPRTDLYVVNRNGAGLQRLTDTVSAGRAAWAPDGSALAFIGSEWPEWWGHNDLYAVRADGTGLTALSANEPMNAGDSGLDDIRGHGRSMVRWADSGSIVFTGSKDGEVQLFRAGFEPATFGARTVAPLTSGAQRVFSASASAGKFALCIGTFTTPGDIFVCGNDGVLQRITAINDALLMRRKTFEPQSVQAAGPGGQPVQTWIINAKARGTSPAVVQVHGGPAAMYAASFFLEWQILAGSGTSVIFCNPRGSAGYGRDFSKQVYGDWGGDDFRDVMAATDAAVATGRVDADALGIAGGSYGGFMTNWAIGHTQRFKAAMAERSISNQLSQSGASDIGGLMDTHMGGDPWVATDSYLRHSPAASIEQMRTPLLLLHGEQDLRCPVSQAHELFTALKARDRDVQMVLFEDASHELSRSGSLRQRIERLKIIDDWFGDRLAIGTVVHHEKGVA